MDDDQLNLEETLMDLRAVLSEHLSNNEEPFSVHRDFSIPPLPNQPSASSASKKSKTRSPPSRLTLDAKAELKKYEINQLLTHLSNQNPKPFSPSPKSKHATFKARERELHEMRLELAEKVKLENKKRKQLIAAMRIYATRLNALMGQTPVDWESLWKIKEKQPRDEQLDNADLEMYQQLD